MAATSTPETAVPAQAAAASPIRAGGWVRGLLCRSMEFLNYVNDDRWAVSRRAGVHVMDVVDEGRLRRGLGRKAWSGAGEQQPQPERVGDIWTRRRSRPVQSIDVTSIKFDAGGGTRISVTGATCRTRANRLGISGMQ